MRKLSETDRSKLQTVKEYLSRYLPAEENYRSFEGINTAYAERQRKRSCKIMTEVESAIALLDVNRGKTIIEKRFILGESWKQIHRNMDISRDTCFKKYRAAMVELYDRMVSVGNSINSAKFGINTIT